MQTLQNAPDHAAAEALSNVEDRIAVLQALDTLPTDEQLVIRALFGIGDHMPMDVHEFSNAYETPRSTVYAKRDRAFARLRAVLTSDAMVTA